MSNPLGREEGFGQHSTPWKDALRPFRTPSPVERPVAAVTTVLLRNEARDPSPSQKTVLNPSMQKAGWLASPYGLCSAGEKMGGCLRGATSKERFLGSKAIGFRPRPSQSSLLLVVGWGRHRFLMGNQSGPSYPPSKHQAAKGLLI